MSSTKSQRMSFVTELPGVFAKKPPALVMRRPRNAKMDALVKHVHSSENYSFENVSTAVDAARTARKAKA